MAVLAAALALLLSATPAPAGSLAAGGTLSAVRARGELRWGADAFGGAPYVFQDPRDPGRLIGFEVELADALANQLGVRARFAEGAWERLLELLARGDFDVAMNGIEVTEEKRRVCLLSRPYYAAAERLTIRRGDPAAPRTLAALAGRKVGTLPGSLAERMLASAGAVVLTYDAQNDIYEDLRLGRTDAVLLDEPIARYYGDLQAELETLPAPFGEVRYAIAVRLGDEPLRQAIDAALDELARDGTLRALYERWGLWNAETAALLGDARPSLPATVPVAYDAWRTAVGRPATWAERITERYPRTFALFARGAALTVALTTSSMVLAMLLGAALAVLRRFGPRPLRWAAVGYIEFFRGTPLLVQLIMIYFGLPELGVKLDPFSSGWLALGLNYAAAEAENYRAGLESVPAGQLAAGRALGMTGSQVLRHVVAPQAIRISIPPMTNDVIALLKDSSLVSIVTLTELTKTYSNVAASTRDHLGLGVVVALWYLALGLPLGRLARTVEARLGRHLHRPRS